MKIPAILKTLSAAGAAVLMSFPALAEKTAKVVWDKTANRLTFVYDEVDYGTKGTDWFSVAEAEAQSPEALPAWASDPWKGPSASVTNVVIAESFKDYRPKHCGKWFWNFSELKTIYGIANLDVSKATGMYGMFYGCNGLVALDLSGFDTGNVRDMGSMFGLCLKLETLDLSLFKTASVTNMGYMFYSCGAQVDVSGFDTSNVRDMSCMFYYSDIEDLDVSHFDTANVECMVQMFAGSTVTNLDLSNFNTQKVRNMEGLFEYCEDLESLNVSSFNTASVTNMSSMFSGCKKLKSLDLSSFDTRNVEAMDYLFYGCNALSAVDVSGFRTPKATRIKNMFADCRSLTSVNVSGFDTSRVTSLWGLFQNCTNLVTLDVSSFDTANVTDMYAVFDGCTQLKTIYASESFVTNAVTDDLCMFRNCKSLVGGNGTTYDDDQTGADYACIDKVGQKGYFTANVSPTVTITLETVTGVSKVRVYTNDTVEVVGEGEPPVYTVVSNAAVKVVYTADEGFRFLDRTDTWETNFTANATATLVTPSEEQRPIKCLKGVVIDQSYVDLAVGETTTVTITVDPDDAATNFVEWVSSKPEIASVDKNTGVVTAKAVGTAWICVTVKDKVGDETSTMVGVSVGATPSPIVTVKLPEVDGATGELFAFNADGGWQSVATNEVPRKATVRVVYTAADGKAWNGIYIWSKEMVASQSVQTADAPTAPSEWTGGSATAVLDLDTRSDKRYYKEEDILPVWAAQGAEVKVKGAGEAEDTTLVKNMAATNAFTWRPTASDVYKLTQTGLDDATITLTTPVGVTTNDLAVAGTKATVTIDGSPLPEDGIVASNSTVRVEYVADSGKYFADGATTYAQTFTAEKAVNEAGAMIEKPTAGSPKVQLGVVAQRYPWDGKLDVQYKSTYTPAGVYKLRLSVEIGGVAKTADYDNVASGIATVVYDLTANFGEVKTKTCKVTAKLVTE